MSESTNIEMPPNSETQQPTEILENLKPWEMTDPRNHDLHNFRYIVYGAMDARGTNRQNLKPGVTEYDLTHDLFKPGGAERLLERTVLSSSLIDQNYQGTWAPCGIILHVPEENIITANHKDIGTPPYTYTREEALDWATAHLQRPLPTASTILQKSSDTQWPYNEVAIYGTDPQTKKRNSIDAVFIMVDREGSDLDPVSAQSMREFATSREIPIVEIAQSA